MVNREDAVVLADGYIQQVHEKYNHKIEGSDAIALALVDVCEELLRFKDSMNTLLEELTALHATQSPETIQDSSHEAEGVSEGEGPDGRLSLRTRDPVQERTFDPTLEGEIRCPNCDSLMNARVVEDREAVFYGCPVPSCGWTEFRSRGD